MRQTKEQKLKKYWEFQINPITGWFEDNRKDDSKRSRNKRLNLNKDCLS